MSNISIESKPLQIEYFSDILCIWAWIAQRRIDELEAALGKKISLKYQYVNVFGNVPQKMATQWASKGAYEGFAKHVLNAVLSHKDLEVNPAIWSKVRPVTSANAHLVLKAVELAHGSDQSVRMALAFRQGFFLDALDISNLDVLYTIVSAGELEVAPVQKEVVTGEAIAALAEDYHQAKLLGIKGSPSYVMDGGRQTLYGNVGYRVLLANAEELLKQPVNEASWC